MSTLLLFLWGIFSGAHVASSLSVFGLDRHGLDQGVHELRAVHRCTRLVRDRQIVSYGDCSVYAQSHLPHLDVVREQQAASAACISAVMLYAFYGEGARPPKKADLSSGFGQAHDCRQPEIDGRLVLQTLADNRVPVDFWPWQPSVRQ